MGEGDADGGVHEDVHAAARAGLMVAMQVGERLARMRADLLAEAARRDSAAVAAVQARFAVERAAAVAQLQVVDRPEWWARADRAQIAHLAEIARTWQGAEPAAAAALAVIERQVRDRYDVDLLQLAEGGRDRSRRDVSEAGLLIAEADRLDRAGSSRDDPGAPAAPHPDGREDAFGVLIDEPVTVVVGQDDAGDGAPARITGGVAYDSAERRDVLAARLRRAGVTSEDIAVRLRADINHARPATEAPTAPSPQRSGARGTAGYSRGRGRGERAR